MRAFLLLLILFGAGCTGCASVPSHEQLKATTLTVRFTDGVCSGTAIGPDRFRSATHCFSTGALVSVNGVPVRMTSSKKNKYDTIDIQITGHRFATWALVGQPPRQGDRLRWWGNPRGEPDVYREGYVSRAWTNGFVIDATICPGDSGAGLFNEQGQLVGVVSAMNNPNGCTFMLSMPMGAM